MKPYLPYIIFGLTTGSIYGISAMGLVLTYKTSGVFNFAHGAVSAFGAYTFFELRQRHHVPWVVAALITLFVIGPAVGLLLERLAVALAQVNIVNRIIATIGIFVCIEALAGLVYGADSTFVFNPFLPMSPAFQVAGVAVSYDNVADLALGIGVAISLYLLFSKTRLGLQMRAVVDDPDLLAMGGTAPARVRRSAWVIGMVLATASGILFAAAEQQIDVNVLSLLVVQAFGAAAIARFTSLPWAFAGGILVGLVQKLASKDFASHTSLQGLDLNIPFIVLFVFLLVVKRDKLKEVGREIKARVPRPSAMPRALRVPYYVALLAVALLVPHFGFVGTHLVAWSNAAAGVLLFLSLGLLVRTSGQISLCHIGFAAIGAAAFAHSYHVGVPWGFALVIAGLAVVPAALIISVPAIRLSRLYLGLATLGFGVFLAQYAYSKSFMFPSGVLVVPRPHAFGLDTQYRFYYLLVGIAVLGVGVVIAVERSRLGRLLRAMADSPVALSTYGTSVSVTRVLVFCISGFMAGVSGATAAAVFTSASIDSYNYFQSLLLLAVLIISGRRTISSAIVGSLLLNVVPNYISSIKGGYALQLGFGLAAIAAGAASAFSARSIRWGAGGEEALAPSVTRDRVLELEKYKPLTASRRRAPGLSNHAAASRIALAEERMALSAIHSRPSVERESHVR